MQEKNILTERKSRRISVGKFLLNVNDLQVALAGCRADKSATIYAVATKKLKVKGKQISPRRLRAKYTHRTNFVYALCISPCRELHCQQADKFVNRCLCTYSQQSWREAGKEDAYRQTFIYQTK